MKNIKPRNGICIHKVGFFDYFHLKEMKCKYCNKNIAVIENWKVYVSRIFNFIMVIGFYCLGKTVKNFLKYCGAVILPEYPQGGYIIVSILYVALVAIIFSGIQALFFSKIYDYKKVDRN